MSKLTVNIESKEFEVTQEVFDLIHSISLERDGLKKAVERYRTPLEAMHSNVMRVFHVFRKAKTDKSIVEINGNELALIVAEAKRDTYKAYGDE